MSLTTTLLLLAGSLLAQTEWESHGNCQYNNALYQHANKMWMAGYDGPVTFDLSQHDVTHYPKGATGIPYRLVEDHITVQNGNMWLVTEDHVYVFNGSSVQSYSTTDIGPFAEDLNSIAIDSAGVTWVGSKNQGLFKFDNGSWTRIFAQPGSMASNNVRAMTVSPAGELWVAHNTELSQYDGTSWIHHNNLGLYNNDRVDQIVVGNNGVPWVGSAFGYAFRLVNGSWSGQLVGLGITDIDLDPNGKLWMATFRGLIGYDGTTVDRRFESPIQDIRTAVHVEAVDVIWTTSRIGYLFRTTVNGSQRFRTNRSGIEVEETTAIAVQGAQVAVATFNNGISVLRGPDWVHYPDSQIHGVVKLGIDRNYDIWAGNNDGLNRKNQQGWMKIEDPNRPYSPYPFTGNYFTKIYFNDQNELLLCTYYHGLIHKSGNAWTYYTDANSPLQTNTVYDIAQDSAGNYWLATPDGLIYTDLTNWTVYDSSNSNLPYTNVFDLALDPSGELWLVNGYNDFSSYYPYTSYRERELIRWNGGAADSIYGTSTNSGGGPILSPVTSDPSGNIWFKAPTTGVYRYSGAGVVAYDASNSGLNCGESYQDIYDIVVDNLGNKWIATESQGISVFRSGGVLLPHPNEKEDPAHLTIFPNPANQKVSIAWKQNDRKPFRILVFDLQGKLRIEQEFRSNATGSASIELSTDALESGLYFVRMVNAGQSATSKLVIVR